MFFNAHNLGGNTFRRSRFSLQAKSNLERTKQYGVGKQWNFFSHKMPAKKESITITKFQI